MSKSKIMVAALMGAGLNINTSNRFGPKGSTGNKYQPHQGKQEIARRLRGKPKSKPRRMWRLGEIDNPSWFRYGGLVLGVSKRLPLIKASRLLLCDVVLLP